jgi:CYTH domain-containing protein
MKIEIERKFLLKSIPEVKPDEVIEIFQWYRKNSKEIWERARSCYSDKNGFYFVHTIKKTIGKGINEEDEKFITSDEFNKFVEKCKKDKSQSRYISKERLVYQQGDLKWEVDVFNNGHHLIVAEIEIPTVDYEIEIPVFIKDKLLMEVTGLKQFSNKNLSNSYVKIEKIAS